MSSVTDVIEHATAVAPALPTFHNTDLVGLRAILSARRVAPRPTAYPERVFLALGRPYYMRPSVRARVRAPERRPFSVAAEEVTSLSFMLPQAPPCLVVTPFDSGRFLTGQFDAATGYSCSAPLNGDSRETYLSHELRLDLTRVTCGHHLGALFGSNAAYLDMRPRNTVLERDSPSDGFEYTSTLVVRSSRRQKDVGFDLSAQTIELQSTEITTEQLRQSVLFVPNEFVTKQKDVIDQVAALVRRIEGYTVGGGSPAHFLRGLLAAVRASMDVDGIPGEG